MGVAILTAGLVLALQPQSAAPLGGPKVRAEAPRTTLVSYDLDGRLRRPEGSPEAAAIDLLGLSPDLQRRVDQVVSERAGAMDRFVTDNLMLLSQLDSASKAGDKLDQMVLLLEGFEKLRPALQGGPLRDRIVAALPPAEATRFKSLYDGYWSALISEGVRDNRAQGKHDARWAVALGLHVQELGLEITRSYERQAASGTIFIDYLIADLDLSPQQKETVRSLKLDMLTRTDFRPTEADQKQLGLGILAYLNERQRTKVLEKLPR